MFSGEIYTTDLSFSAVNGIYVLHIINQVYAETAQLHTVVSFRFYTAPGQLVSNVSISLVHISQKCILEPLN